MNHEFSPDENAGLSYAQDVIAALSTGSSASALAVLRVSGKNCVELLSKVIKTSSALDDHPRKLRLCEFIDPKTKELIDKPLLAYMPGPKSFTGEDTVELSLHGGPYIVQRALETLYAAGCRAADPGEFTRRAYLNGKMDLTTAEGIRYLVEAQSEQQWMAGQQLSEGRLANDVNDLRHALIRAMAFLEARIDFPDEGETAAVELQQVHDLVADVSVRIKQLMSTYESGRIAADGLRVALVGPPNAGKSTLFNNLLGTDRALVTDIAGTTRDYLEEGCRIEGRLLRIIDTAGLRDTDDPVERLGIARAREILCNADVALILAAADQSQELTDQTWQETVASIGKRVKVIHVLTKADLSRPDWAGPEFITISTKTEDGIGTLKETLCELIDHHVSPLKECTFVTSARHVNALKEAQTQCLAFFRAHEDGAYDEMLAFELQRAASSLANLVGEIDHEDVLDKIFSEFCVGK